MRRIFVMAAMAAGAGAALVACGSSSDDLCEFSGTCGGATPGDGGGPDGDATVKPDSPIGTDGSDDGSNDGGLDALPDTAPPGCEPGKDPKDSPPCVTDDYGIFVSPKGSDSAAGTMAAPVQTIATALTKTDAKHPRIYVCATAGDFKEQISVTAANDGLGIYGGWDCTKSGWPYTGTTGAATLSKVDPAKGVALKIVGTANGVTIEDVQVEGSADIAVSGDSAIAVFASNAKVTFKRVAMVAHDGIAGQAGPDGIAGPNWAGTPTAGKSGDTNNGGAQVDCSCNDLTTSHGGAGGGKNGGGLPGFSSPDAGYASGGNSGCSPGTSGPNGTIGGQSAGAASSGTLDANGWKASTVIGQAGVTGRPASGGGGGGGDGAGGGGGGGCGGCGGSGGKAGTTGGSSFALLVYQSVASATVTLLQSTLKAGNAGVGAKGGTGQPGQAGAGRGTGACGGGIGGNGPGGGGGGGGAGGISAAIAYHGTEPTVDGATAAALTPGLKGDAGAGGGGGLGGFQNLGDTQASTGAAGLAGADGVTQPKVLIP